MIQHCCMRHSVFRRHHIVVDVPCGPQALVSLHQLHTLRSSHCMGLKLLSFCISNNCIHPSRSNCNQYTFVAVHRHTIPPYSSSQFHHFLDNVCFQGSTQKLGRWV